MRHTSQALAQRSSLLVLEWTFRVPWIQRKDLKSKAEGKLSVHFRGDEEAAEVVLRTIISVDQLSVYGAAADMCDELAWRISGCSEIEGQFGDHGDANRIVDNEQNASDQ